MATKKETAEAATGFDPVSGDKMVEIMIPRTSKTQPDFFVAVNGRNFQIQRGKKVSVPEYIAAAIEMHDAQVAKNMEDDAGHGI